jgi:putative oxidoreductase
MLTIRGIPFPALFLIIAIIIQILGGFSVLLGYKVKIGALVLIGFLVPITVIYHTNFNNPMTIIDFMKNVSIIGGLLMVAHTPCGKFSIEGWLRKRKLKRLIMIRLKNNEENIKDEEILDSHHFNISSLTSNQIKNN